MERPANEKLKELSTALGIATDAHVGQVDKAGLPYILHPISVMQSVDTIDEKIVAILHDVVEDSQYTLADLLGKGISVEVVDAIALLTHDEGVPYADYVQQIKDSKNALAIRVKRADLAHNLSPARSKNISDKHRKRYMDAEQSLMFAKGE